MKKVLNVLMLVAVSAILMQSCKSKPSDAEVQGIAESYLKAIVNEDYDKAKELGTDKTDGMLEQLKMFSSMIPDSMQSSMDSAREVARNAKINFGTTTFNEEGTEATISFSTSATPDNEETLVLKKVDKNWLVDWEESIPMN